MRGTYSLATPFEPNLLSASSQGNPLRGRLPGRPGNTFA